MMRLNGEIDDLINHNVTTFILGGTVGFDQIAAALLVAKREMGSQIRLIFALSCKCQDQHWSSDQKRLYQSLLAEVDEVMYLAEEYHVGCHAERNRYLVEHSAYCIYAWLHPSCRIRQTIRYARHRGLKVINVAKCV